MNKLRILLVVLDDDKFYRGTIDKFNSDDRIISYPILCVDKKGYKCKIKDTSGLTVLWNKKMISNRFQKDDYDVVYLFSLDPKQLEIFRYIPIGKKIVWWAWGFELYETVRGLKPLFQLELYKSMTRIIEKKSRQSFSYIIKSYFWNIVSFFHYDSIRAKAISRVNYFQPVFSLEYEMMSSVRGFNAKEFYYPNSYSYQLKCDLPKNSEGSIFIGNSATYTNNHIDIWESVKDKIPFGRKVYIPINYGDKKYGNYLTRAIHSDLCDVQFLKEFIPKDQYFKLIDGCSYAIFGVIRQQAMGNISYALSRGIKVFLYKDSLVYKQLKKRGFVVYDIESISPDSFTHPLSEDEIIANSKAIENEKTYRRTVFETVLKELMTNG